MRIVKPSVELLWVTPEPEKQIEIAARTCYKSEDKITKGSASKFIKALKYSGHHAMLEHASASFRIITDRGISHEIVRHRIASYTQESSRYCNYSKNKFGHECSFIEPPGLTESARITLFFVCRAAERGYFKMLANGYSPQIARSVLPTCTKTELVMTANFREWIHFIKLRSAKSAHPQIRPIAQEISRILAEVAPNVFDGEETSCVEV